MEVFLRGVILWRSADRSSVCALPCAVFQRAAYFEGCSLSERKANCMTTMKVVQIPYCFYPDPMGGTEVYVADLARELALVGVESCVAMTGTSDQSYVYKGVRVRRYFHREEANNLRRLYGDNAGIPDAGFVALLQSERPDILHIHAFVASISLGFVRAAKAANIPVVFTYHTPAVTCQRGTMLRFGLAPCDGLMDLHACSRCTLHGLGMNRSCANVVGRVSPIVGFGLGRRGLQGGAWTAFRMTELMQLRIGATSDFLNEVDHVLAVCDWVKQVLLRNGVPGNKIALCRQGVSSNGECKEHTIERDTQPGSAPKLRICFLGRLDPIKGVDVLLQAVRSLPHAALQLDIFGISQGKSGEEYAVRLRRIAQNDARICFCDAVPADEVVRLLTAYDLLAVPSQCQETGPLVVLEAFEAGVPVLGSSLGGIAELVQDGLNGILVDAPSPVAWRRALCRVVSDHGLLSQLRRGVKHPRTMREVADEVAAVYRRLSESGRCISQV